MSLVIFLLALGVILIVVEILLIPGTSITGIMGLGSLGYGIWLSYNQLDVATANVTVISTIVLLAIVVYFSLKSKTWRKAMLNSEIDSKIEFEDISNLKVGDVGTAHSRLASVGKAQFGNVIYEVYAYNGFIDEGKSIKIFKIEDNKIFVTINK